MHMHTLQCYKNHCVVINVIKTYKSAYMKKNIKYYYDFVYLK